MANPQIDNGFTKLANEILDALALKYTDRKTQILFVVLRETYGWSKKEAIISYSKFEKQTGIAAQYIPKLIKQLEADGFIAVERHKTGNIFKFQKDYDKWITTENSITENGITENGITENGITENGITENGKGGITKNGNSGITKNGNTNRPETPDFIGVSESLNKVLNKDKEIYSNNSLLPVSKNETVKAEAQKVKKTAISDEEFIRRLKDNIAYKHIDVDSEVAKMQAWLLLRPNRKLTKRFILNWLNRIEKPMEIKSKNQKSTYEEELAYYESGG